MARIRILWKNIGFGGVKKSMHICTFCSTCLQTWAELLISKSMKVEKDTKIRIILVFCLTRIPFSMSENPNLKNGES